MIKFWRATVFIFLSITVLTTTGCEPLRKKFVRKKKTADTEARTDVIFDPTEYPAAVKSAEEIYGRHYGLLKVWHGELTTKIEDNANDKKLIFTLGQMEEQLLAMRALVTSPLTQADIDQCMLQVKDLVETYRRPIELRNKTVISTDVHSLGRFIREKLSPQKIYARTD